MTELPQDAFLKQIAAVTEADSRLIGLLVGGSHARRQSDRFSDIDCLLVAADEAYHTVLEDRRAIAARIGPLLHAFTGEHVGEPRMLVCLYERPTLHVDYKVVTAEALRDRAEEPLIVWCRDESIRIALEATRAEWPSKAPEWFEERFWVWAHNTAMKIGRGELFEALDLFAYLRWQVFGPLLAERAGERQYTLRRIERLGPEAVVLLTEISPPPERDTCARALVRAMDEFVRLNATPSNRNPAAEAAVRRYLDEAMAAGTSSES
jgi:hypothetical protein